MKDYPTVRRQEGHYDFAHPNDTQANYCFTFPQGGPNCFSYSVPVDSGHDTDEKWPLDMMQELLAYAERCLYCGSLQKLREATAYLEEHEGEHAVAFWQHEVGQRTKRLDKARKELAAAKQLLAQLQEPATA